MTLDPTYAWAITRGGKLVHIRLTKGMAEACANIERDVYAQVHGVDIKVVPVLMTEIEDVK